MTQDRLRIPDQLKDDTPNNKSMFYHRKKPARSGSFIEARNAHGGIAEVFSECQQLSSGHHGITRLFSGQKDKEKQLVVKQMTEDPEYEDTPVTQQDVDEYIVRMNWQLYYFGLVYPQAMPCGIKHFIAENGKYDYRLTLPYLGKTLSDYLQESVRTAEQFALLTLKVAEAVDFIHSHGIYHGDVNWMNILCRDGKANEFGMMCPEVHLIDFSGGKIGEPQHVFVEVGEQQMAQDIIDEIRDIIYFKDSMNHCLTLFSQKYPQEADRFRQQFPQINTFIALDDTGVNKFDSHTLSKAIPIFRKDLQTWHASQSSLGANSFWKTVLVVGALAVGAGALVKLSRDNNNQ